MKKKITEIAGTENIGTIKDITISLNSMQSGKAEIITEPIIGVLKAMILSVTKALDINITLAGSMDEITLFQERNFSGRFYMPLRISAVSKSGKVFNYAAQEWVLNEPLRIVIAGQFNAEPKIIIIIMEL